MKVEIEAKFLDIDKESIRKKLIDIGASLILSDRLMKRKNFDFPDGQLYKIDGWARVRNEGDKITMSYKQVDDRSLQGTKEVNLIVNNFDTACKFLESLGLEAKTYQETKRESWQLGDVEIEIDTWPWVPTFLEIEGPSEEKVKKTASKLGLDWSTALHGSVEIVYQKYYAVTDEEIDCWEEIIFIPVPKWLLKKKMN